MVKTQMHVYAPPLTRLQNKTISDPYDEILRLQGVGWFMRKLIASVTITLYIKHYKDADGNEHIDIEQIGTGGFKGNYEQRTLTWSEREVDDGIFGPVGEFASFQITEVWKLNFVESSWEITPGFDQ